jgi:hypothetical protein
VILLKPGHDFISLWVQDKLAALQSYGGSLRHTSALHHPLNVFERKMLHWPFLPDVAVLALRLTERSRVNHQL